MREARHGGPRQLDLRAVARTLADHGDTSLTMAEIASQLNVAKPTLYRMAGSKEALLNACLDSEAERLLDHLREHLPPASDGEFLQATLQALNRYAEDSPGGFSLMFERRIATADLRLRRVEAWVADVVLRRHDGTRETVAAGLIGAAAATVAVARRTSRGLDSAAAARELLAAMG